MDFQNIPSQYISFEKINLVFQNKGVSIEIPVFDNEKGRTADNKPTRGRLSSDESIYKTLIEQEAKQLKESALAKLQTDFQKEQNLFESAKNSEKTISELAEKISVMQAEQQAKEQAEKEAEMLQIENATKEQAEKNEKELIRLQKENEELEKVQKRYQRNNNEKKRKQKSVFRFMFYTALTALAFMIGIFNFHNLKIFTNLNNFEAIPFCLFISLSIFVFVKAKNLSSVYKVAIFLPLEFITMNLNSVVGQEYIFMVKILFLVMMTAQLALIGFTLLKIVSGVFVPENEQQKYYENMLN